MARVFVSFASMFFLLALARSKPVDDDMVVEEFNELDDASFNYVDEDSNTIDLTHLSKEAYGIPKNESGDAVAQWTPDSLENPEEMSGYAEGDILMPKLAARNGIRSESYRWKNGIIPYSIEGRFSRDERDLIMKAIADYHRLSCVRFVPYNGQQDYLAIVKGNSGCWSSVGRIGGRQELNLQTPNCVIKKGTVIHEMLHAAGFMHEQSRPERDEFVDVMYHNIRPGTENNFKKETVEHTNDFGVTYDYNSVMHYSEYAFSKNKAKTIVPKINGVTLGQREGFSRGDVKKLNKMYNCKKEEPQTGWVGAVWNNLFGDDAGKLL